MNPDGRGFSVSIDQLLAAKALWVPPVHVYLAAGDSPVAFQDHQKELAASKGKRILESVAKEAGGRLHGIHRTMGGQWKSNLRQPRK